MNQKQRANWEQTRAKGLWRFVLLYWVLGWGGVMIIATSLYSRVSLSIIVPLYLVAGFVSGLSCWLVGEDKYRKSLATPPQVANKHSSAGVA